MKKQYFLVLLAFISLSCHKSNSEPVLANPDKNLKGCGDFSVSKIIGDDMIMSVYLNPNKVRFSKLLQTFDNIATKDFANVEIEQNCDLENLWYYTCNDIWGELGCETTHWTLQNGQLSFKVSKVLKLYQCTTSYLATVILENVTFKNDKTGETRFFDRVEFLNVKVGTCAG